MPGRGWDEPEGEAVGLPSPLSKWKRLGRSRGGPGRPNNGPGLFRAAQISAKNGSQDARRACGSRTGVDRVVGTASFPAETEKCPRRLAGPGRTQRACARSLPGLF